jgi:metal-responsive CopG/Arc/MetJ family transcriptional regulator
MVKSKLNATIDATILEKWEGHCKENCINRSQLIEKLIRDYLDKKVKK